MNAVIVCVDFHDLLALTLSYNREHFDRVVVVTSPWDRFTRRVALDNDAVPFITDVFYQGGAHFNKGTALEHALDFLGRKGWLCILDADIVLPKGIPIGASAGTPNFPTLSIWVDEIAVLSNLYTPRRRMLEDLSSLQGIPSEDQWTNYPLEPAWNFAGYTQIFHGSDPVLATRPWFGAFTSAAGGDTLFQDRWEYRKKVRPNWEVLHLGPGGVNWAGRVTPYLDGTLPEKALARKANLEGMLTRRLYAPPGDMYKYERLD